MPLRPDAEQIGHAPGVLGMLSLNTGPSVLRGRRGVALGVSVTAIEYAALVVGRLSFAQMGPTPLRPHRNTSAAASIPSVGAMK